MEQTISQILKNHYVDGIFHTHVSLIKPKGKYQFNRQGLEDFWTIYSELIKDDKNKLGMAEKPQHYLPVLADIDLKIKETDDNKITKKKIYSDEHVLSIIGIYQSVLRKIVEECSDEHLLCVLLEKPLYRIDKHGTSYVKNGWHLHFPCCFLSKIDQEVHLIPRVRKEVEEMKVFADLEYEVIGDIIDKSCCSVPWLMLGSRKDPEMDAYKVSKVYDSNLEELSVKKAFRHYPLYDEKERVIEIKDDKLESYMPRILSIIPYGRETQEIISGLISPLKEKLKERKVTKKQFSSISVNKSIEIAKELLLMLSTFRAEDRNEWITIGWILYNISEGSPEGLDLWCEFSCRCPDSYDEATCIYQWERMIRKGLTLGTLRYYASVDSPEVYLEFKKKEGAEHVKEALNGSHNDIAKVLAAEYGDEFRCASITGRIWFQFRNHIWESIEDGVFLRQKISSDIVERFSDMGGDLFKKMGVCDDKSEEAMHNERMKRIQKMMSNLKSAPYKTNVMKEAMEVFYDRRFREKLDTNPFLIAFKNGVYDLKLNVLRPGRPEDFISKALPINYTTFNESDDKVQDVYSYLEKVFPDKSVRKYFMDTSSDVFVGGNFQKIVLLWSGEGDNAKSVTQTIFEKMLGKLAIKLNTTVVTGKKVQSGSANADLARAGGGVRWAVMEEPGGDEMINDGILNNLSGNDSFYARDLFEKGKEGREIIPMFKLIFICNKLPKLRFNLKATWNRLRVIPFESVFVRPNDPEGVPESYEEQLRQKRFPMDKNFAQKIPGMLEAFAWVLLEHRKTITVRIEPEKVRSATADYRRENDKFREFLEENIIEDKKASITLTEMFATFKEWFRESMPNHTLPIKKEVEDYFTKLWDEPEKGKRWVGYRVRTLADDVEDGSVVILEEDDLVDYDEAKSNLPDM